MRFEVMDSDGQVKMSTEHQKCIYPLATLKKMETAGCKFRLNGKRWKPGQEIPEDQNKPLTQKKGRRKHG